MKYQCTFYQKNFLNQISQVFYFLSISISVCYTKNLSNKVKLWKRLAGNAYYLARLEYIDYILLALNSFQKKYIVYRKKTCTDLYMNWYSFVPKSWKWGTLKTLVRRAHINCSTEKHLKEELNHIRKTFNEINNYPHWVITKVFKEIKEMTPSEKEIQVKEDENTSIKNHLLVLTYPGEKGIHIVNSMKRYPNKILPKNVKVQTVLTGKQLSSCFKIKSPNEPF